MRFRLVVYNTNAANKYEALHAHEFLGDASAIWFLWFTLTNDARKKHVEVFNLAGQRLNPELGLCDMVDCLP